MRAQPWNMSLSTSPGSSLVLRGRARCCPGPSRGAKPLAGASACVSNSPQGGGRPAPWLTYPSHPLSRPRGRGLCSGPLCPPDQVVAPGDEGGPLGHGRGTGLSTWPHPAKSVPPTPQGCLPSTQLQKHNLVAKTKFSQFHFLVKLIFFLRSRTKLTVHHQPCLTKAPSWAFHPPSAGPCGSREDPAWGPAGLRRTKPTPAGHCRPRSSD